ncbi:MAG: D-arabinitol dehydrogenase [Propionibacteriaceae bacterium]|nr:D-arabinitol dehydrogenase [Propionibacteriaceae bacterium]
MKSVVYDSPENFEIRDVAVPVAKPGQVLVRLVIAGVCGTDLHLHHGEFGPTYPLTPGHEMVGEVTALGMGVTSLAVGDLVAINNTEACGFCANCRRARSNFCLNPVAQGVNAPGGFAEYVVASAELCHLVNDLDPDVAVFAEPTACAVHGLDMLDMMPGSDTLVFGTGPTGLLLIQLLARNGAGRLTVAAPTQFKLDIAAARGADEVVLIDRDGSDASAERLQALAPAGFDVVIDATGALPVLQRTIPLTRDGGTIFVYGMTRETDQWAIPPYEVFRRELTIKGSFAQCYSFDRSLLALRQGRVDTSGMITHRFAIHEYADALKAVADSDCVKAVITP